MEAPSAKKVRVHFGSFEEHEKKRIEQNSVGGRENGAIAAAVQAGIKAGNINIDGRCALIGVPRYWDVRLHAAYTHPWSHRVVMLSIMLCFCTLFHLIKR